MARKAQLASVERDIYARILTKGAGCSRIEKWLRNRIVEKLILPWEE